MDDLTPETAPNSARLNAAINNPASGGTATPTGPKMGNERDKTRSYGRTNGQIKTRPTRPQLVGLFSPQASQSDHRERLLHGGRADRIPQQSITKVSQPSRG